MLAFFQKNFNPIMNTIKDDSQINTFTCYLTNNTTSGITLNALTNDDGTPSVDSGNPVVIAGGNSSTGGGSGYYIPQGSIAVKILKSSGGCYLVIPQNEPPYYVYPKTKGSATFNLSDGTLVISWDDSNVQPVVSDGSQWQAVVDPYDDSDSAFTITVQAKS